MASQRRRWTRDELLVAFGLYLQIPFSLFDQKNPEVVRYAKLINRSPGALAMKLSNLASLDDSITNTGRKGLTNTSNMDREMWAEMNEDWMEFSVSVATALESVTGIETTDTDIDLGRPQGAGVNVLAKRKVRRGHALFRKAVLSAYNQRCCVTGMSEPKLLVASHIIPWHANSASRLNPRNGLCLSALHDRAFDRGLITFDDDLRLRTSSKLAGRENPFTAQTLFALEGRRLTRPTKFAPDPESLAYHRLHIFLG